MIRISEIFASYFQQWGIDLPPESLENRAPGEIECKGWIIKYRFASDDTGAFLEFYATNRMTNDRHVRIYEDGQQEMLPALLEAVIYPPDATEEQKAEAEDEYRRHNQRVVTELKKKGFM